MRSALPYQVICALGALVLAAPSGQAQPDDPGAEPKPVDRPNTDDPAGPEPDDPTAGPCDDRPVASEMMTDEEVIEMVERLTPGSIQSIGSDELERFEYNDVHQVLGAVPGVYIRQEDGYGLRPNIGMRGSGSERSAKIALMEDGVLIAPAPYSAPAAYYFPLVTRMERVDVLKGPSAIQYGPNTVGGAVNLISKRIPRQREGTLDMAGGADRFGKLHITLAERRDNVALMVEGLKLRTDGFKNLDGGGNTGFDKNDVQIKLQLHSDTSAAIYHQLDIKLGYSDEVSDETYTGLTESDFTAAPYRRYAATQLDRMTWDHWRAQVDHQVDFAGLFQLTTTVYRNQFSRDWSKLDGFADSPISLPELLAQADTSTSPLYAVLIGAEDSTGASDNLLIGTNSRDFVSQGVQISGQIEHTPGNVRSTLMVGLRYHFDRAERFHFEDSYAMTGGLLVAVDEPMRPPTLDATGTARALAAYAQDRLEIGVLTITAGLRAELVETVWRDRTAVASGGEAVRVEENYSVLIPGVGAVYQLRPELGILAGVHRGFVPVAPGQGSAADPEKSVNYEAGLRYAQRTGRGPLSAELIGFFSDYSNLKGSCTFSSGCASEQVGDEFNGGDVNVLGVEALAHTEVSALPWLRVPLRLSYTFTRSRFQSDFTSRNPIWGDVNTGDELPYVPAHQLAIHSGVAGQGWDAILSGRYVSAMRDSAGQGDEGLEQRTDAAWVLDLAGSYGFGRWGKAYLTVDNLLDRSYVVSRRPFGARPGKPRTLILGYKNRL
ncbi:MAG: TonB-dependent receptor [Myxococcota bacterium]